MSQLPARRTQTAAAEHMNETESYSLPGPALTCSSNMSTICYPTHSTTNPPPPPLPFFIQFSSCFSVVALLPKQPCIFVYSVSTNPLSLCEPLLRRQAWVERPLGSGSRYCRTERWSILDNCRSTEQQGGVEQNQSILVRMQDIALLFTV